MSQQVYHDKYVYLLKSFASFTDHGRQNRVGVGLPTLRPSPPSLSLSLSLSLSHTHTHTHFKFASKVNADNGSSGCKTNNRRPQRP